MKTKDVSVVNQTESFNIKIDHCGYDLHSYLLSKNKPITHYGLFVIFDGHGEYILNGKHYPIENGDVCYIPRGTPYTTRSNESDPFKLYYLAFNSSDGISILNHLGFSESNPVIHTKSDYIKKKFAQIYKLLSYDSFNNVLKANMLLLDVFYFFSKQIDENNEINTYKNQFVKRTEEIIQQNYTTDLSVDSIAKQLHLNRTYLSHLFALIKGITIKQFITVCRIDKAIELLGNTELTVAKIAQEVGFNDSVSFYRQFKKLNGVSPKQYQQATKNDNGRIQREKDRLKLLKIKYDEVDE